MRPKALAKRAETIYREIGRELTVSSIAEGGGTDVAFASLKAKGPVIERFGFAGFGAFERCRIHRHFVDRTAACISLARMVMEVSAR